MATAEQLKNFIKTVAPLAVQVCNERCYGNAQAWTCVSSGVRGNALYVIAKRKGVRTCEWWVIA